MPRLLKSAVVAAVQAGALAACLWAGTAQAAEFVLTSPELADGAVFQKAQVYNKFGCTGDNHAPRLRWTEPPAGTRSLALTVYDPDAPTGSGWWHWLVFNLPAEARGITPGTLPAGAVESRTDFGSAGYGGPCPPVGDAPHRYIFTVHALKTDHLPLDAQASGAMVGYFLKANSLGTASFTAYFGR